MVHHDVVHRLFEVLGLLFKLSGRCEEFKTANFETDEVRVSILLALALLFRTVSVFLTLLFLLSVELGLALFSNRRPKFWNRVVVVNRLLKLLIHLLF